MHPNLYGKRVRSKTKSSSILTDIYSHDACLVVVFMRGIFPEAFLSANT